jgi:HD-GYP domain-containing protein (c-di-GMP phosphodiesterase class II)
VVRPPGGTWVLRAAVFAIPVTGSLTATVGLIRALPSPATTAEVVVWWLAVVTLSTGALAVTDRMTRRLLPLAGLFRLSLIFPERAPSRLRVAMRSGDARRLQDRLEHARRNGLGDTPARAAECLLELVAMLDAHDRRTRGHSERVRGYTAMIGRELGLSRADLNRLQWAALLHDVGKLYVPVGLLDKPGRLTDDEFQIVRRHPQWGADLVSPMAPWLGPWCRAVIEHHERWDGKGYPWGLCGREISLAARIVSVADAYDVMTSTRSYRDAMSTVKARRELVRCSGTQFDPDVVRAFLRVSVGRIRPLAAPLTWAAQIPLLIPVAASAGPVTPAMVAGSTVVASITLPAGVAGQATTPRLEAADHPPRRERLRSGFHPPQRWCGMGCREPAQPRRPAARAPSQPWSHPPATRHRTHRPRPARRRRTPNVGPVPLPPRRGSRHRRRPCRLPPTPSRRPPRSALRPRRVPVLRRLTPTRRRPPVPLTTLPPPAPTSPTTPPPTTPPPTTPPPTTPRPSTVPPSTTQPPHETASTSPAREASRR